MNGSLHMKMQFITHEVHALQEENKTLRQLLDMNIATLKICSQPQSQQAQPRQRHYRNLYAQLLAENQELIVLNQRLSQQRNEARSQVLVNEQLAEGAHQRQLEMIQENDSRIQSYKSLVNETENQVYQCEQLIRRSVDDESIPSRFTIRASAKYMRMFDKCQLLLEYYGLVLRENQEMKEEAKRRQKQSGQLDLSQEEIELNESYLEILPDKIQLKKHSSVAVPKLNLQKAFKIQTLSIKKQEEQDEQEEMRKNHPDRENNLNRLYLQLQNLYIQTKNNQLEFNECRKKIINEILNTEQMSQQLVALKTQLANCNNANDILIRSQQGIENKWRRIYQQYQQYERYHEESQDRSRRMTKQQFLHKIREVALSVYGFY